MLNQHVVATEIFEVLERVGEAATEAEQVNILRINDTPALRTVLKYAYDPMQVFDLPDDMSYIPSSEFSTPSSLRREYKQLQYCDVNSTLKPGRKVGIFKNILEGVHPKDAILLMQVINKEILHNIDSKTVISAFPKLF